jgi:hypothetical protein
VRAREEECRLRLRQKHGIDEKDKKRKSKSKGKKLKATFTRVKAPARHGVEEATVASEGEECSDAEDEVDNDAHASDDEEMSPGN